MYATFHRAIACCESFAMERSPSQVASLNGTGARTFSNKLVCLLQCGEITARGCQARMSPKVRGGVYSGRATGSALQALFPDE